MYAYKLDNQEIDKLLETYTLVSRSNEETESLIRYKILRTCVQVSETSNKEKAIIDETYQTIKQELTPIILKVFPKFEEEGMYAHSLIPTVR